MTIDELHNLYILLTDFLTDNGFDHPMADDAIEQVRLMVAQETARKESDQ